MIPIGAHERHTVLDVWRATLVDDGAGGQIETLGKVGQVRVLLAQPTAAERTAADRSGARLDQVAYAGPHDDVRRGDELRGAGEVYRVTATVRPSEPVYLRVECERAQAEE
ncbi:hypothetical protein ABZ793_32970 [Micromonospora sp. NPDC047465]|uniref:hypothetical protein n=1 Tax=Micromonospora sp. NPDC047465 TaxID=3154813 RepID=UPI0033E6FB48